MFIAGFLLCTLIQDIALPLMRDERWERDTLFLVFEEDFRFSEHEDPEPVMVKAGSLQEVVGQMAEDEADQERVPLDASSTVTGPGLHRINNVIN